MPVATQATVKALTPDEVSGDRRALVIMNTYHLWLRPGPEVIAAHGGLHRFSRWPHAIATDSGGFQAFSLARTRAPQRRGFRVRLPPRRREAACSRRKRACASRACSAPTSRCSSTSARRAAPSRERLARGGRLHHALGGALLAAKAAGAGAVRHRAGRHRRRAAARARRGARSAAARRPRARRLQRRRADRGDARDARARRLPARPGAAALPDGRRHAAGSRAGDRRRRRPVRLRAADAQRPQRSGVSSTRAGSSIKQARYRDDQAPLEPDCACPACTGGYSRAYLRHLYLADEMLAHRLLTLHNLHHYGSLIADARARDRARRLRRLGGGAGSPALGAPLEVTHCRLVLVR